MFVIHIKPLQSVQPLTKLSELRQKFLFHFRRHPRRLRKEPEHVGIALLRLPKGTFGVFPVAHAVGCFGNINWPFAATGDVPADVELKGAALLALSR